MPLISFIRKQMYIFAAPALITIILLSIHILVSAKEPNRETLRSEIEATADTAKVNVAELDVASDFLLTVNGTASHYGKRFHNRRTASGEKYDMYEYSAAHKKLPFGTILKVTNTINGLSTIVRINDRGPYVGKRVIDLSYKSAQAIKGLGLPKISFEGFIPGKIDIPDDGKYFFAYSLTENPVCLPSDKVEIINQFDGFHTTVTEYKALLANGADSTELFILIDADEYTEKQTARDNDTYFIGKLSTPKQRKIPFMMAEKVYP